MRTEETNILSFLRGEATSPGLSLPAAHRRSQLGSVTPHELEALRESLSRNQMPTDLAAKLESLRNGSVLHRFVEQNSRLIVSLLIAAYDGSFREASPTSLDQLLRVVAYVRKDQDAVPDYDIGGFTDDQQELRAVVTELSDLLQTFKSWRLRYQVPQIWTD